MHNIFTRLSSSISSGIIGSIVFGFIIYVLATNMNFNLISHTGEIYIDPNYTFFIFLIFFFVFMMNMIMIIMNFVLNHKKFIKITNILLAVTISHIASEILFIPMYLSFGHLSSRHLVTVIGLQIIYSIMLTLLIQEYFAKKTNLLAKIFAIFFSTLFTIMIILFFYRFQGILVIIILPFIMSSISGAFCGIADMFSEKQIQNNEEAEKLEKNNKKESTNFLDEIEIPPIKDLKHDYEKDYDGY